MRALKLTGLAVLILVLMSIPASGQHDGDGHQGSEKPDHHGDSATTHRRFEDAERWAEVFENPERDEWQKPDYVVAQLHLAKDAIVADIGSATGYFAVRLAAAVPEGKVYGIDIEESMVSYLNGRAEAEGLDNLVSILGKHDDPMLPEPVDLIFVCDTYHHIGDRVEYFHRLIKLLKPGGRVVNVDFKPGDFPVGPKADHKLKSERVIAEMFAAGYELRNSDMSLPYQYILEFSLRPELNFKSGAVKDDGK